MDSQNKGFLTVLESFNVPKSIIPKLGELYDLNMLLPLKNLIDSFGVYKSHEINFGFSNRKIAEEVTNYLESMYPGLKPHFSNNVLTIDFENIKALNTVEAKLNDLNLAISDRRTIIVIADNDSTKIPGIPHFTMSKAKELFKFPPNHPIVNTAYAMAEVYPDHYIQLSEFHEYFKQTKHAAFIELCASLGAKEICIEKAEINNQNLDINSDIKAPLASLGLGINVRQSKETGEKVAFSFSEENKGIKEYDSPWINSEASWRSMNNLRRKNHLHEVGAEFTCVDDMGINVNLTSQIQTVGVNIGGSFSEMTKIRLSYNVVFW